MRKINMMERYPTGKGRADERPVITEEQKAVSKQFGFDYFDGDRKYGYGGFNYNSRFWSGVVEHFKEEYNLNEDSSILDIGCAKGFTLFDFSKLLPSASLAGIDISDYAIENAVEDMKPFVQIGNAKELPYEDNSFDLVISINTLHNLPYDECMQAVKEIQRVSRKNAFIMVDGYKTNEEKEAMDAWVLTAKTMLHEDDWIELFKQAGYSHDYWFWVVQ
jgi:ubiquinone/menaquinone biosynthesis C-methylase UbiE